MFWLLRISLSGAEHGSRVLQGGLDPRCERVRAAKYASRGPCRLLKPFHGLAEIVERGVIGIGVGA